MASTAGVDLGPDNEGAGGRAEVRDWDCRQRAWLGVVWEGELQEGAG